MTPRGGYREGAGRRPYPGPLTRPLCVFATEEQYQAVKALAAQLEVSVSELLRRFIDAGLAEEGDNAERTV